MLERLIVGCGYLGLRVALRWRDRGDRVFALTRTHRRASELAAAGLEPIVGDVTKPDSLRTLGALRKLDTVLFAVGFDRSAEPSKRAVYVDGLRNVLDALPPDVASGEGGAKLLSVSSTSVYGSGDGTEVDERTPPSPDSDGGRICLDAETLFRDRVHHGTILRLSGLYGPNRVLANAETLTREAGLPGTGEEWLNLIHVDDAAGVVHAAASHRPPPLLLVSDTCPIMRRDYYTRLAALIDASPPRFNGQQRVGRPLSNRRCQTDLLTEWLVTAAGGMLAYPSIATGLPAAVAASGPDR